MSATQGTNPPGGGAGPSTTSSTSLIPREPPAPHRRSRLLTWSAFTLIFLVVLFIAGALTIYAFVKPKGMIFKVDEAYVHEYNITGTCHNESLNAVYNITMISENDNKKVTILYYHINMYISCNKQQLANNSYGPLRWMIQGPGRVNPLPAKLYSVNVPLKECTEDYLPKKQQGNMTIDVALTAKIWFKPKNWMLDGRPIRVSCSNVNAYLPGGYSTFQPKTCTVEL